MWAEPATTQDGGVFSYSGGHRLTPPSRTLWTDPDYPSGPNPQRPVLPGHFTPKKDSLQWTEIPRHCAPKLWKLSSQWGLRTKRDPKSSHFPHPPHTPHRHTWESKGAQPHPRNPAQYPGISCGPLSEPPLSLLLRLIQTELVWPDAL